MLHQKALNINHSSFRSYSILSPSPRPPDEAIGVEGKGAGHQVRRALLLTDYRTFYQTLSYINCVKTSNNSLEPKLQSDKSKRHKSRRREDDFEAFVRRNKLDTSLAEDVSFYVL